MAKKVVTYRFIKHARHPVFVLSFWTVYKTVTEWMVSNASISPKRIGWRAGKSIHPIIGWRTFCWQRKTMAWLFQLFIIGLTRKLYKKWAVVWYFLWGLSLNQSYSLESYGFELLKRQEWETRMRDKSITEEMADEETEKDTNLMNKATLWSK